jgi:hypothetical protein
MRVSTITSRLKKEMKKLISEIYFNEIVYKKYE